MKISRIKQQFIVLVTGNNKPKQIALGVAVGVFIGITPTYGFHIWTALLVALLIPKINKVAVILGTQISTPMTAMFICWINYQLGRVILQRNYPPLSLSLLKNFTGGKFLDILFPLFAGSIVLGTVCSLLSYFITLKIICGIRKRHNINS